MDEHPTSWVVSPNLRGSIAPIETVMSSTDDRWRDYEEIISVIVDTLRRSQSQQPQ